MVADGERFAAEDARLQRKAEARRSSRRDCVQPSSSPSLA